MENNKNIQETIVIYDYSLLPIETQQLVIRLAQKNMVSFRIAPSSNTVRYTVNWYTPYNSNIEHSFEENNIKFDITDTYYCNSW